MMSVRSGSNLEPFSSGGEDTLHCRSLVQGVNILDVDAVVAVANGLTLMVMMIYMMIANDEVGGKIENEKKSSRRQIREDSLDSTFHVEFVPGT